MSRVKKHSEELALYSPDAVFTNQQAAIADSTQRFVSLLDKKLERDLIRDEYVELVAKYHRSFNDYSYSDRAVRFKGLIPEASRAILSGLALGLTPRVVLRAVGISGTRWVQWMKLGTENSGGIFYEFRVKVLLTEAKLMAGYSSDEEEAVLVDRSMISHFKEKLEKLEDRINQEEEITPELEKLVELMTADELAVFIKSNYTAIPARLTTVDATPESVKEELERLRAEVIQLREGIGK